MAPLLAVAVSLTILVLSTSAAAQTGPVRPAVDESPRASQWVCQATSDLGRRQGRFPEPGVSVPLRIPATIVDTVWTQGTSWKQGTVVGTILGLGLCVAAAAGFEEEDVDPTALCVGCKGIATAGGAPVGTIFGVAIPRWKRRYP